MDWRKLVELLRATIDRNQRQQAEEQLAQIHKIIGFAPMLLQVVMMNDVEMPVRQAGAIYFKNLISQNWTDRDAEPGELVVFTLHEQDRFMVRDNIVEAMVHAPELISVQLAVCLGTIIKHDFPGNWTQIVDKISIYLQNPEPSAWPGALLALYKLVKNYEFKKPDDRVPLHEAMRLLLPQLYRICVQLLPDAGERSVLLQKQALKIFYALTQHWLPLDLIGRDTFAQWMELTRLIAERPVPEAATALVEEDERADLCWWKCKKWALHIMYRIFERYGSPGNVTKEFKEFSEWYLPNFTAGMLEVVLKLLDQYRNKVYVSPRVLQQALNYINQGVAHAFCWKLLKPHMEAIIQDVIFPLMSYSAEDDEMWKLDPHEYIRIKFDVFEDFVSPTSAAQTLLHTSCRKRKDMLYKTMQLMLRILTCPSIDPAQKDGALHMIGSLADVLLKKQEYADQIEGMFLQYVFPEFANPRGHLRARACWVLHYFSEMHYKQETVLAEAVRLCIGALLADSDLPVKVQAAIALQSLVHGQERSHKYIQTQIKPISLELLTIIRETENEDLTGVMQRLVCTFIDDIAPIAVEICQHLAATFSQVLAAEEASDEKVITALGLLNTIETILTVMEEQRDVMLRLEPIVIQVIGHIFQQGNVEFYDEAFSLLYELTAKTVSGDMWKMLELVYQVFRKNALEYFVSVMPALHNYVTVDTEALLSSESHLLVLFSMCKAVMESDAGEDPECHAAKLLEVMILQCRGRIDTCIPPIVELVLNRLTREVKTSELRTMCLQVVIAALYYNPVLLFSIMEKISMPNTAQTITSHFIKQWIHDTDCFLGLHDRKMCVLGLCTLIDLSPQRPPALLECAPQIVPSLILLFDGLKRAYVAKAQDAAEEEDSSDDDDEEYPEELSSSEDDIDEDSREYLDHLAKHVTSGASRCSDFNVFAEIRTEGGKAGKSKAAAAAADAGGGDITNCGATVLGASAGADGAGSDASDADDDDDDDDDANEETALETYTTPLDEDNCDIDEYVVFKQVLIKLQLTDPSWHAALTGALTAEQRESLKDIFLLADQRKAAMESKKIEQSGGYAFTQQTVPTSFNFSGH